MNGVRPGDGRQKLPSLLFFQSSNGPLATRQSGTLDGLHGSARSGVSSHSSGYVYHRKAVAGNPSSARDGRTNGGENSNVLAPHQVAAVDDASVGEGEPDAILGEPGSPGDLPSHSDSADDVSEVSFGDSSNDIVLPDSSAHLPTSHDVANSILEDYAFFGLNQADGNDDLYHVGEKGESPASQPTLGTRDTQGDATASLLSVHVTECSDSVHSDSPSQLDTLQHSQSKAVKLGGDDSQPGEPSALYDCEVDASEEQPNPSPPEPIPSPDLGRGRPVSLSLSLPVLSDSGEDFSLPRTLHSRHSKRQSSEVDMSLSPDSDMISVPETLPHQLQVRPMSPPVPIHDPASSSEPVQPPSPSQDSFNTLPQPTPSPPFVPPRTRVEVDGHSVQSGASLSLPQSITPFSVRSLQPVKCSVSLSGLMAGVGRAGAPSAPSPGTISIATARHTEASDPRQLVRTPVPYKRSTRRDAGKVGEFVWPDPVSKNATVSPSPVAARRLKSPGGRSSSGISTFTGVQSVRGLPTGLRRAKSAGRAPIRTPIGPSPLHDVGASVLVHGQPNLELLQRLKDCLAIKAAQSGVVAKSMRSASSAGRRRSTSPLKKRKPRKSQPSKTSVMPSANFSLPPVNTNSPALSSPVKSPLTMAPPSLPSPWAVVESGDLRQHLVKAARSQPVPITARDNLSEKEVEHPPFRALPYHHVGPEPTMMLPHAPELPDAGLPVRDAEYRHHVILTGNPNLLPLEDSVRAREVQEKIVTGQGARSVSYHSIWQDVVQYGLRESAYPAAWSGYHSYSDEDHTDFASSTHPTVSSTHRVPSLSADLLRQQRATGGDNQSLSDHGSSTGRPFPERFLFEGDGKASEEGGNGPPRQIATPQSHRELLPPPPNVPHVDNDDLHSASKLDDHSTIGPVLPCVVLQRESSFGSSSDNQESVITKQTKMTDSFFDVGNRPSRTTRRRHRRRKGNGETASVMSSRSRRSGRSVDSLADVALAAMKNSKGFVATMKDKIEEVERKHSSTWQKALMAAAKEIRRDRGEQVELSDEEQRALEAERRKGRRHSVFETMPTPSSEGNLTSGGKRPPRPLGDRSFLNTSKTNSSFDFSQGIASPPRAVTHTAGGNGGEGREHDSLIDGNDGEASGSDRHSALSAVHATPLLARRSDSKLRKPSPGDGAPWRDDDAGSPHTTDEQHSDAMSEVSMDSRQAPQPRPSACGCGTWCRKLFKRRR